MSSSTKPKLSWTLVTVPVKTLCFGGPVDDGEVLWLTGGADGFTVLPLNALELRERGTG